MAGSWDACLIAAFAAGFATIGGETPALADDQASIRQGQVCGGDEIARGIVGKILDGRTFVLDDGREVRLAAIEVAPLAGDRSDPAGRAAAAALAALAAGDQVVLRRAESGSDRYGHLLAYAYTLRDGDEFLLQRELVAEGFAWAPRKRPARPNLAFGPIRIMRCSTPRARRMHWRTEADFALVEGKCVRARKRAHNLCEFRPATYWGHYGYDPETKRAQFRGGGS